MLALPARLVGLGVINPCRRCAMYHSNSKLISLPRVQIILNQSEVLPPTINEEQERKRKNARRSNRQLDERAASSLKEHLPTKLKKAITINSEKGDSSWLSALPISEHGFALYDWAFRDALCLRYSWRPSHLPSHCVYGQCFKIEYALRCPRGGFRSIRHNEIRNITACIKNEVCQCGN